MYHATNTIIALPDTRSVRSDSGYTPATQGYNTAAGDVVPYNPDNYPGVSVTCPDVLNIVCGYASTSNT